MKITPQFGIGKLIFGMKQKDVEYILGKPDKNFKDDDQNVIYVYDEQKLRLTFYEDEDFKLGYLISSNANLILLDQRVIGAKPSEIKEALIPKGYKNWEQEDFDMTENHFNEANWIILQSEFGKIIKVELGAVINSKDELDWKF